MHSELSHASPWTAETVERFISEAEEMEAVKNAARERGLTDLVPKRGFAKPGGITRYIYGTAASPDGAAREVMTWAVSGNLTRALLRRYIVRHTLDILGIPFCDLQPGVIQGLFSGGILKKGLTSLPVAPRFLAETRRWLPMVDVFGGVFNGVQIPGCLRCGFSIPVVQETLPAFFRDPDFGWVIEAAREHYGGQMVAAGEPRKSRVASYTRHYEIDAGGSAGGEDGKSGLYVIQSVPAAGLCLGHSLRLVAPFGEMSEKCFLAALALLCEAGVIGGKGGIGYGFFTADYKRVNGGRAEDLDLAAALREYESWAAANRDKIAEILKAMSDQFKYNVPESLRKSRVLFDGLAKCGLVDVFAKAFDRETSEDGFVECVLDEVEKIEEICSTMAKFELGAEAKANIKAALTPKAIRDLRNKMVRDMGEELFNHMAAKYDDESAAYDVDAFYPSVEDASDAQKKAGSALKVLTDFFTKLPSGNNGKNKNNGV